ncbi:diguanylate cyclase [Ramlibacter sp. XY19]|uniref:sensor domain-containing diguanylate cyclase n=1 Tax=Ramlibacter paludis TaxID=2908000 RepID=UPI0023DA8622|nr:7TM diverse intracellular signaling domain-containing protein [Ramlibacter paludis]MCG2595602.1 diguanylate cyclase [Ramlibacter paludis]
MRWLAAGCRAGLFGIAVLLAAAPAAQAATPVVLADAMRRLDAQPLAATWFDAEGNATLEQVVGPGGAARFTKAAAPDAIQDLGSKGALWLHLNLARGQDERQEWVLEFPMPVLDLVTVYQRSGNGWRAESAGDTLAVNSWPEGGRYPYFRLDVPAGEARDVYVRIRHTTPANFPLQLVTAAQHAHHIQLEYLALGTAVGALLLLVAGCLARGWVYRDRIFAWYALYAMVTSLAVASFTGVAAHLLWPGLGALSDAPMAMLAAAAGVAGLLFVRNLIGLRRRFRLQDRLLLTLAVVGGVLAVAPPLLPKMLGLRLLGAYLGVTTLALLGVGLAAWRRGDVVGKWVFAAYFPMTLSVLASFMRIFGWLPVSTGSQYGVVLAMGVEVPLLLVALTIRSRDRHSAQVREQALSTHDALTGLLAPHLFQDRLRQVCARFKRDGQSAAVMFIDLVNHARIKEHFGAAVAEQSLLRSVIKLRRLVRDVDTIARMGEARFAVILEGAALRASVTDRAARLIAAGLMPLPGLKPDVTLQFHIAALLLSERPLEAGEIEAALAGQLALMSPRTRRPIRFILPEAVPPSSDGGQDSSLFMPADDARRSRPPLSAVG